MKELSNYFNNVNYLFGSLFTEASNLFSEDSIVNEDFMEKFKDAEDRKELNKTVVEMRRNNVEKEKIVLKNKEEIVILVK